MIKNEKLWLPVMHFFMMFIQLKFQLIFFIICFKMGQSSSQQQIQQQYQIVKSRADGSALLKNKKTKEQILLRNVCSNIGQQISGFEELLRRRQSIRCPHLLNLLQIRRKEEKNVCSVVHKLYLLIEYPFKTLYDEMNDKIATGKARPFTEDELWSIIYSCSVALNTLYNKKMPHESFTAHDIYISKDGLIKISDPLLLGLQKNYIKVLKNEYEHVHISPQIMNFLDDCNFSYYDKQKSDIFILGAIMLEASLLKPVYLYEKSTKRPMLDILPQHLNTLKGKYSPTYVQTLEKMLQLHSKLRPKFSDIINIIQQDSNLHEDTVSTIGNQPSITGSSFNKSKVQKGRRVQSKPQCTINSIYKNASNPHLGVSKINLSQQNNNQTVKIKKNEQNAPKNQIEILKPPQNYIVQPQHMSQNLYFNSPKPLINVAVSNLQNHVNQTNSFSSIPTINSNYAISCHNIPYSNNAFPTPSQFVQNPNERFSYNKFGNITLETHKTQNKPIFSHQIPQVNQILNKQNQNPRIIIEKERSKFVSEQSNPPILATQPKLNNTQNIHISAHTYINKSNNIGNIAPSSNYRNVHNVAIPNSRTNFDPSPIVSSKVSQKQKQQTSKNQIYTIINESELNSINKLQINKFSLANHSKNQVNISPSNQKPPSVPQLNFEGIGKKTAENIIYVDQSKLLPGLEKKNSQPNPLSLNNLLKQNQEKNTIFAVTQKSSQNDITSPLRNDNTALDLLIKIKQPQQSPGPKNIKIANPETVSRKSPSAESKYSESESEYVKANIEGGGRYEGYIKNGMKNGEGKLQFNDGGYYLGQWKNNQMHGYGKLYYENGQVAYQGNWQHDQFCGEGRVFNDRPEKLIGSFNYHDFADLGQKWLYYEGQFKNDSKHGLGKIRLTNGQVFEGNFIYDSIEGEGTFYTNNKEAIHGFWRDNVLIQK